jgi:hypothetical protein
LLGLVSVRFMVTCSVLVNAAASSSSTIISSGEEDSAPLNLVFLLAGTLLVGSWTGIRSPHAPGNCSHNAPAQSTKILDRSLCRMLVSCLSIIFQRSLCKEERT